MHIIRELIYNMRSTLLVKVLADSRCNNFLLRFHFLNHFRKNMNTCKCWRFNYKARTVLRARN